MQDEYEFYIPPLYDNLDDLEREYVTSFKKIASKSRDLYFELLEEMDSEQAYKTVSDGVMQQFINGFK